MCEKRTTQNGFTLIELMIVVALVGIVAAFALPSFNQLIANSRVSSTTNGILGVLNYARGEAVKSGSTVSVEPIDGSDWDSGLKVLRGAQELLRYEDFDESIDLEGLLPPVLPSPPPSPPYAGCTSLNRISFAGNGFITTKDHADFVISISSPVVTQVKTVQVGFAGVIRSVKPRCI